MDVTSGNAQLAFDVVGSGQPAVLFLHAGVADRRSWNSLVAELSPTHRCITFDARGFGETTFLPEEGWSPVTDALAVMDAADQSSAVVVGSSQGGSAAVDLALAHPERVDALLLIGAAVRGAPYPDPTAFEAGLDEAAEAATSAGDIDEANRLEARLWLDGPTAPEGRVGEPVRARFLQMNGQALRSGDPGRPMPREPSWPRLMEIDVPTLVVIGEYDVSDVRAINQQLAAIVPSAQLVDLPGTAHLPFLEEHSGLLPVVMQFLAAPRR